MRSPLSGSGETTRETTTWDGGSGETTGFRRHSEQTPESVSMSRTSLLPQSHSFMASPKPV